jgi:hypothetical protein
MRVTSCHCLFENLPHILEANMSQPTKPDPVLAFRTITTILHALQTSPIDGAKPTSLQVTNDNSAQKIARRRELRILDAIATLLVRDNEIVAVVSKRGALGDVEVVACDNSDPGHDYIATPNPRRPPAIPRPDDVSTYASDCGDPVIVKPPTVNISIYDPLRYVLEVQ